MSASESFEEVHAEEDEENDIIDLRTVKPKSRRNNIVREIFTSEQIYVNNLNDLAERIIKPLSTSNILPPKVISSIFSNLQIIRNFHLEFLNLLTEKVQNWNAKQQIGSVFLQLAPFMKIYTQYCSNYDNSIAIIKEHKTSNIPFAQFLTDVQKEFKGQYITSFLILPIQRIPRYELFLKDLLKLTNDDHPDKADITSSFEAISSVAEFINNSCSHAQNIIKTMEISKSFGIENLVTPTRRFVREDDVTLTTEDYKGESKCFLFNDCVVFTLKKYKSKSSTYISCPLHLIWLQDAKEEYDDLSSLGSPVEYNNNNNNNNTNNNSQSGGGGGGSNNQNRSVLNVSISVPSSSVMASKALVPSLLDTQPSPEGANSPISRSLTITSSTSLTSISASNSTVQIIAPMKTYLVKFTSPPNRENWQSDLSDLFQSLLTSAKNLLERENFRLVELNNGIFRAVPTIPTLPLLSISTDQIDDVEYRKKRKLSFSVFSLKKDKKRESSHHHHHHHHSSSNNNNNNSNDNNSSSSSSSKSLRSKFSGGSTPRVKDKVGAPSSSSSSSLLLPSQTTSSSSSSTFSPSASQPILSPLRKKFSLDSTLFNAQQQKHDDSSSTTTAPSSTPRNIHSSSPSSCTTPRSSSQQSLKSSFDEIVPSSSPPLVIVKSKSVLFSSDYNDDITISDPPTLPSTHSSGNSGNSGNDINGGGSNGNDTKLGSVVISSSESEVKHENNDSDDNDDDNGDNDDDGDNNNGSGGKNGISFSISPSLSSSSSSSPSSSPLLLKEAHHPSKLNAIGAHSSSSNLLASTSTSTNSSSNNISIVSGSGGGGGDSGGGSSGDDSGVGRRESRSVSILELNIDDISSSISRNSQRKISPRKKKNSAIIRRNG